jgi:predicted GNAT family N-acyltransferase
MEHAQPPVTILEVRSAQDFARALFVRRQVFVLEQKIPLRSEFEHADCAALHVLALQGGQPVGTGRLLLCAERARIGRLAVLAAARRHGVGSALLSSLLELGRRHGVRHFVLHAQIPALPLYLRAGFHVSSSMFLEDGLLHCRLERHD